MRDIVKTGRKQIVEVTLHAKVPSMDCGGYQEKKRGQWMLRLADEVERGLASYKLTKRWQPGHWPNEFYPKKWCEPKKGVS